MTIKDFGLISTIKFKGIINELDEVGTEKGSLVKVKGSEHVNKK